MKRLTAMTLIELLVVVTIVAIIASLALPSYQAYLQETRRQDAFNAISKTHLLAEQYFLENGKYPANTWAGYATTSENGHYTILYQDTPPAGRPDDRYRITATVASGSSQSGDVAQCQTIVFSDGMQLSDHDCFDGTF